MIRPHIVLVASVGIWLGVFGMANDADAQNAALAPLVEKLSAGDLSVLREGLKSTEHQMMTTEGSANDAFWSALEGMRLMKQLPLPKEMGEAMAKVGVKAKVFVVTPEGQSAIPPLVGRLKKN